MTIPRGPWAHRHLGEWTGAAVGDISSSGDTGLCAHGGGVLQGCTQLPKDTEGRKDNDPWKGNV